MTYLEVDNERVPGYNYAIYLIKGYIILVVDKRSIASGVRCTV